MMMSEADREIYYKVLLLAGSSALVHEAVHEVSWGGRRPADLKDIVAYIVELRPAEPASQTLS